MCSIDTVKELISLTKAYNLTEIEVHHDMMRIRIKKNGMGWQVSNQALKPCQGLRLPPSEEKLLTECREIISPMVGTFYRAISLGAKPYVDIGNEVDSETVVCVIETMKIINEIKANVVGKVVEILVEDGEAVEFSQPLFRVQSM